MLCEPLEIAGVKLRNRVALAPMSGVSDLPFRRLADRFGAGMVVSEMVASEQLVQGDPDAILKTHHESDAPFVIQLAGRQARWMAEGARIAEDRGADIIDINMGCPARKVTGGNSGSALMRNLDHAMSLIDAVIRAVRVPVSLKMRLGWDENSINAPELARRAEEAGVQMLAVHGRTRCQFFKGRADWRRIAAVKAAVAIPVIANGDITRPDQLGMILAQSNADAVMIGRGAYGAPWLPGRVAAYLHGKRDPGEPSSDQMAGLVEEHFEAMLDHYGTFLGLRKARKHLGWYVDRAHVNDNDARSWRARLCRPDSPAEIRKNIRACFKEIGSATA